MAEPPRSSALRQMGIVRPVARANQEPRGDPLAVLPNGHYFAWIKKPIAVNKTMGDIARMDVSAAVSRGYCCRVEALQKCQV